MLTSIIPLKQLSVISYQLSGLPHGFKRRHSIALRYWVRTHFKATVLAIENQNRENVLTRFGTAIPIEVGDFRSHSQLITVRRSLTNAESYRSFFETK